MGCLLYAVEPIKTTRLAAIPSVREKLRILGLDRHLITEGLGRVEGIILQDQLPTLASYRKF